MGLAGEQAEGWKTEESGEEGGLYDGERLESQVRMEAADEQRTYEEAFLSSSH